MHSQHDIPNSTNVLTYMFGSLRPSERKVLLDAATTNSSTFLAALEDFLAQWAGADWLEKYNVQRVGKWIATECPRDILRSAENMARRHLAQNSNDDVWPTSIYVDTYEAFLQGIERSGVYA